MKYKVTIRQNNSFTPAMFNGPAFLVVTDPHKKMKATLTSIHCNEIVGAAIHWSSRPCMSWFLRFRGCRQCLVFKHMRTVLASHMVEPYKSLCLERVQDTFNTYLQPNGLMAAISLTAMSNLLLLSHIY